MIKKILIALILGVIGGIFLGSRADSLGVIGSLIIKLLKMFATPLIFLTIVNSIHRFDIKIKQALSLLMISTLNAVVAIGIALMASKLLSHVGMIVSQATLSSSPLENKNSLNFLTFLDDLIPKSILQPFLNNDIIAVVALAVIISLALRKLKTHHELEVKVFSDLLNTSLEIVKKIIGWVFELVPIAVFCVIAKAVGTTGFEIFKSLALFGAIVLLAILIHCLVYYSILLISLAKVSPLKFYRQASEPIITALSLGSSLATLPVTLDTMDYKMKLDQGSSRLAACVGTNLNHDGIILYEAIAALYVAQIYGVHLDGIQKIKVALTSVAAAIGIAGIPDAGLITLTLVLSAVGLPVAAAPLLLPIDWFIGRLRATANVISDLTVANILNRFSKSHTD
jgi:Na+/H+-dicarboxylate symporter